MNNTCPNPGCGAVYTISPQHIGARMTCRKCGEALIIGAEGLQFATMTGQPESAAGSGERAPAPAPRKAGWRGRFDLKPYFADLGPRMARLADTPTWLFGTGAFLIIACLFFEKIDETKRDRIQAKIDQGAIPQELERAKVDRDYKFGKERELAVKEEELKDRELDFDLRRGRYERRKAEFDARPADKQPDSERQELEKEKKAIDEQKEALDRDKSRIEGELADERRRLERNKQKDKDKVAYSEKAKEWEADKDELEKDDLVSAGASARSWKPWYKRGMLLGFLLLFFGALGYLMPGQPLSRKIVAVVVVLAVILLLLQLETDLPLLRLRLG
jgi:hypothetical protein